MSVLFPAILYLWVLPQMIHGTCPTLYGSSDIDVEGLRLFLDLNDEELEDVPSTLRTYANSDGTLDVIQNGLVEGIFGVREFALFAPPIPSSVRTIPVHIQTTRKLYYSLSIVSSNGSVLGPFVNVTPNNVAVLPGSVRNLTTNICCRENGTVLLTGCLSVSDEPFEVLNGSYSTLAPFYAQYQCTVSPDRVPSSMQCPSSLELNTTTVKVCFTRNQTLELVSSNARGWGVLGSAVNMNLCGIYEGGIQPFLVDVELTLSLPIEPRFQSLEYYFDRSENVYNWMSPAYYSMFYIPRNATVVGPINFSIPFNGRFKSDILNYAAFLPCLSNGESLIDCQLNVSGVVNGYVVSNYYSWLFYKICMPSNFTPSVEVTPSNSKQLSIILPLTTIPTVVAVVIVVALLLILITKRQKKQVQHLEELARNQIASNDYAFTSVCNPFDFFDGENMEYNFAAIEVVDKLGEGFFGIVYKARALGLCRGGHTSGEFVAVKTLKNNSEPNSLYDFAKEMKVCLQFDHPNVIRLLAVCTESVEKCMIFEFMDMGSLDYCLRSSNPGEEDYDPIGANLSPENFLPIVLQLGKALEYLSSLQFIHRDIAARNCLLNTELTAKIGDFGLSRNISAQNYYRIGGGKKSYLPIRWMPPEALLYGKFTLKSDVWSFGILMWEVFTFGQLPYTGLSNHEVIDFIKEHRVLSQPELCPLGVYDIMKSCWIRVPSQRATMSEIVHRLELYSRGEVDETRNYVNLVHYNQ